MKRLSVFTMAGFIAAQIGVGSAQAQTTVGTDSTQATSGLAEVPSVDSPQQAPVHPSYSSTSEPAPGDAATAGTYGVPLTDIADVCARVSKSQVVVDPSLQGTILIQGVRPEGGVNYCSSFANALRVQGLTIVRNNNVYQVVVGSEKADIPPYRDALER